MADWDFVFVPADVHVEFQVHQTAILVTSMRLLGAGDHFSGMDTWLTQTAQQMDAATMQTHNLVFGIFDPGVEKTLETHTTFPDWLDYLAACEPSEFLEMSTHWMTKKDFFPGMDALIQPGGLADFLTKVYAHKGKDPDEHLDQDSLQQAQKLLQEPEQFKTMMIDHLTMLWDTLLAEEWSRREAMLRESAAAFSQLSYEGMNGFEAIEAITGRDMRGLEYFSDMVNTARHIIFMPSPHMGPYVSWMHRDETTLILFFGARTPPGTRQVSTALSRSDLLVRLNALADDTRLRIIEMLHEHEELCAQDFIERLDLSQSSASRHLRQLSASGYLSVRRRDTAKCYTLNQERIDDTLKSLTQFLHGQTL